MQPSSNSRPRPSLHPSHNTNPSSRLCQKLVPSPCLGHKQVLSEETLHFSLSFSSPWLPPAVLGSVCLLDNLTPRPTAVTNRNKSQGRVLGRVCALLCQVPSTPTPPEALDFVATQSFTQNQRRGFDQALAKDQHHGLHQQAAEEHCFCSLQHPLSPLCNPAPLGAVGLLSPPALILTLCFDRVLA